MVGRVRRDQPEQRFALLREGPGAEAGKGGEGAAIAHVAGGERGDGSVAEHDVPGNAELEGDAVTPAVQGPSAGASLRDIGIAGQPALPRFAACDPRRGAGRAPGRPAERTENRPPRLLVVRLRRLRQRPADDEADPKLVDA